MKNFTIYKFHFEAFKASLTIEIPEGSEILSTKAQHGFDCIWIKIPTDKKGSFSQKLEKRLFHCLTTGNREQYYNKLKFIGTNLHDDGNFVTHIFEEINE